MCLYELTHFKDKDKYSDEIFFNTSTTEKLKKKVSLIPKF